MRAVWWGTAVSYRRLSARQNYYKYSSSLLFYALVPVHTAVVGKSAAVTAAVTRYIDYVHERYHTLQSLNHALTAAVCSIYSVLIGDAY